MPQSLPDGRIPPPTPMRRNAFVPDPREFTVMQQLFCDEYLLDLSPEMAAIRAGYDPRRAATAGRTILRHPPAADYIRQKIAERSVRTGVNQDRVLHTLGALFNSDPGSLFDEYGALKQMGDISAVDRLQIVQLEQTQRIDMDEAGSPYPVQITKLRFVDKISVANLLMKHLGMFAADKKIVEHHTIAQRLREARLARDGKVVDGEFTEIEEEAYEEPQALPAPAQEPESRYDGIERGTADALAAVLGDWA